MFQFACLCIQTSWIFTISFMAFECGKITKAKVSEWALARNNFALNLIKNPKTYQDTIT